MSSDPIGPFPDPLPDGMDADEYDRLRRRVLWSFPTGLFVVGSTAYAAVRAVNLAAGDTVVVSGAASGAAFR